MDIEEIKEYIKNNLTVTIKERWTDFGGKDLEVSLKLEGVEISSDTISINEIRTDF